MTCKMTHKEANAFYGQYTLNELNFDEEDFVLYAPGGYHPVSLGDRLHDGRYDIRHKLGWGAFGTVWLARDVQMNRWVAVKIIKADRSGRDNEHQDLLTRDPAALDSAYVVRLLDHFKVQGPNGLHSCLVFDLLGPTVNHLVGVCRQASELYGLKYFEYLGPPTILKISRQLLSAVAYVHSSGYVHGDISTSNIAFTTQRLSHLGENELFRIVGIPQSEKINRCDGAPLEKGLPSQLVEAAKWSKWMDEMHEDIRLIDFDGMFLQTGPKPEKICQPPAFQAPESLLMNHLDARSDLWSLGVVIHTLVFSITSFYEGRATEAISAMVDHVGNFPPEWQSHWDHLEGSQHYNIQKGHDAIPKIEAKLKSIRSTTLRPLLVVLRGLLKLRPSDRITAQEALEIISTKSKKRSQSRTNASHPRRESLRKRVRTLA